MTSVRVSEETASELRIAAAVLEITMTEAAERAIDAWLNATREEVDERLAARDRPS